MARNLDRVAGIAEARQGVSVPINRKFMRFVDGGGVSWTLTDDPANDEVEVSATASGTNAPTGSLMQFAGTSAPVGWLECNGTAYGRTGGDPSPQPTLFAVIGTTWGPGDGSTTFNVPDFRRRTPVGRGGVGTGTLGNAVGNVGGAETHALSTAELATHGHTLNGFSFDAPINSINNANPASSGGAFVTTPNTLPGPPTITGTLGIAPLGTPIANSGSGTAHNNMQPSAVVMMIIKT